MKSTTKVVRSFCEGEIRGCRPTTIIIYTSTPDSAELKEYINVTLPSICMITFNNIHVVGGSTKDSGLSGVPKLLLPQSVTQRCDFDDLSIKLEKLHERGIELNTWQAIELVKPGEGSRCLGKTVVAMVRACEDNIDTGFELTTEMDLTGYDIDANTPRRKQEFIRGLAVFIDTYYSDVYNIVYSGPLKIKTVPKQTYCATWWRT